MNTARTFKFNSVEYDTERFIKGQMLFTKIKLDELPVIDMDRPPFICESIKVPIVISYGGKMIVMSCTEHYYNTGGEGFKNFLLVTKPKAKSFVYQPYVPPAPRVEEEPRNWNNDRYPRRDGNYQSRPYQSRDGYNNRNY